MPLKIPPQCQVHRYAGGSLCMLQSLGEYALYMTLYANYLLSIFIFDNFNNTTIVNQFYSFVLFIEMKY